MPGRLLKAIAGFAIILVASSTSALGPPPPTTHTLTIEVSGMVVLLDKTNMLRIVLPDMRAAHDHYAFLQFQRSDLADPSSIPDSLCALVVNSITYCTVNVSKGHVFALSPAVLSGPALSNISAQMPDVIPMLTIASGATLKGNYDQSPPNSSLVAGQLDLTKGIISAGYREGFYWDFKASAVSTPIKSLCFLESVLINEPLNVSQVTFDGFTFNVPDNSGVKITLGNMDPNDEYMVSVSPKPSPDVHFSYYYDFLNFSGTQVQPYLTTNACPTAPKSRSAGAASAVSLAMNSAIDPNAFEKFMWSKKGSNCPPIRIK